MDITTLFQALRGGSQRCLASLNILNVLNGYHYVICGTHGGSQQCQQSTSMHFQVLRFCANVRIPLGKGGGGSGLISLAAYSWNRTLHRNHRSWFAVCWMVQSVVRDHVALRAPLKIARESDLKGV